MPIRVLLIAGSLRIGGSERILIQILRQMDRTVFEPHLALLACEGTFLQHVPHDVPVHSIGVSRARFATLPFACLCWRLRPLLVMSFAAHLNSAVILAKWLLPPGTRVAIREGANITLSEVASAWRRKLVGFLYRRADAVVCQSEDMIQHLTESFHIPKRRLFRIYNSVDPPALQQSANTGSPYRGGGPHLACIGRLVPVKGMDLLIQAMPSILERFPHATLTLVGDGPLRNQLTCMAQHLSITHAIRFLGYSSNPFPFIRHASVVVIPSRSEAFSNVALEALSLGTPVVATDCPGGMREIAQHTRRLHLCVMNSASLANAVRLTLASGESSKRTPEPDFLQYFSPARMMRSYTELMVATIGHSGAIPELNNMEMTTR